MARTDRAQDRRNKRSHAVVGSLGTGRARGAAVEINARFELVRGRRPADPRATMIREVGLGLSTPPRSIPPKYFYDAAGSRLFDAICDLPEYYLTRSERWLLEQYADRIVERTGARSLVELGSGMARKTGHLARALCA